MNRGNGSERRELAARIRAALIGSRNDDGGWGYYPGKASRLEPTSWATLALATATDASAAAREASAAAFLRLVARWRGESGLVTEGTTPPNLAFNGLAALVCEACKAGASSGLDAAAALRAAIARTYGARLLPAIYQRQNNRLRGWPWHQGTFSWTEPTAWCLLALKRAYGRLDTGQRARIGEAEAVLVDRHCSIGGWNVGNSNVLGKELPPHVPTTAVALLALQDRPELRAVQLGGSRLRQAWPHERSGFGLSLAAIALAALGSPTPEIGAALAAAERTTGFLGNFCVMAMVAVALDISDGGPSIFTL